MVLRSYLLYRDSLAERSKAPDSSSGGAIRVGSNPTAVNFILSLENDLGVVAPVKVNESSAGSVLVSAALV